MYDIIDFLIDLEFNAEDFECDQDYFDVVYLINKFKSFNHIGK